MDDSCAVCAEALEWVAFGPCGHREVCSTCVSRLRFICDDRRCCICKTESNTVFVTKALGDYTKTLDFSTLPTEPREGKLGYFWYHEDTQAFFDDVDQYRMIKAMCRLSCSVCENMEEQPHDGSRRRQRFRNIEQLKGHFFHKHKLQMCILCLEGRKVFICEQKLYTRSQLNQHIRSGDSEVDGSESERGGFAGHPLCEFCRTPFYGDNELYLHMSTEHYTCHICLRQHPGQYEYYRNYDDLEVHFRGDHFLCEDEACLAKKFVVFTSEGELKRHNALEHGGHMSRSQRNAVLQIPTSFRYRRSNEAAARRGRGRGRGQSFRRESGNENDQLSMAIQASLETVGSDRRESPSSNVRPSAENEDRGDIDPLIQPFESLATSDSEQSSRYLQAAALNSQATSLVESSFPPLATTPSSSQQKNQNEPIGAAQTSMAARLRRWNNVAVPNVGQVWPGPSHGPVVNPGSSSQSWPAVGVPVLSSGSNQNKLIANGPATGSSSQSWPAVSLPVSSAGSKQNKSTANGPATSNCFTPVLAHPSVDSSRTSGDAWSSKIARGNAKMKHSSSASELNESRAFNPVSDFPPVTANKSQKPPAIVQDDKAEDIQTANKSLVEKIRTALDNDEDKYTAFKIISQDYRQGAIDTWTYFDYVEQFALSHLVLDLARLCPDGQKQRELIEAHNASLYSNEAQESAWGNGSIHVKEKSISKKVKKKGKKVAGPEDVSSKDALADHVLDTVRRLQSSHKPSDGEVEVLDKGGYRASRGKSKAPIDEKPLGSANLASAIAKNEPSMGGNGTGQRKDGGVSKKGKKTSKFLRVRLGDGSAAALSDFRGSGGDADPERSSDAADSQQESSGAPARGVWRNMGGQKLLATAPRRT